MSAIERFFTAAASLPVMPEVARQLIASFDDDGVDLRTIVELTEREQSLAVKVLRLANSARYSASRGVSSLRDAAVLLGMDTLRNLVLSAAIADAFPRVEGLDRIRFWKHSIATGGYARALGRLLGVDPDSGYLAGFMLRSGQLLIARTLPQMVADIEVASHAPGVRFAIERRLIGCTHAQVTAELARRWNLPPRLVDAFAHTPEPLESKPFSLLAAVLNLSATLADAGELGIPAADALQQSEPLLLEHLQLDGSWLQSQMPTHEALTAAVDQLVG